MQSAYFSSLVLVNNLKLFKKKVKNKNCTRFNVVYISLDCMETVCEIEASIKIEFSLYKYIIVECLSYINNI